MSLEEKKRRSEAERMLQNESGMSHVLSTAVTTLINCQSSAITSQLDRKLL